MGQQHLGSQILIVGLRGKIFRFTCIRVPCLQTAFIFIIKVIFRNLRHGVHQFWVDVISFDSIPNFGAYAFVQINKSEFDIWVGKVILTQRPD